MSILVAKGIDKSTVIGYNRFNKVKRKELLLTRQISPYKLDTSGQIWTRIVISKGAIRW